MLYMSGGGVQIFSMGIVFMLLLTPFKNIAGMNDGEHCCNNISSILTNITVNLSLCAICTIYVHATEIFDDSSFAKSSICGLQSTYPRGRPVEV